jgi:3-oxoacyl-[acyl-carrier protein] reductase
MDLLGKKALVTGGAAGFGLRLTEQLVQEGASVVIFDINKGAIADLEARLHTVRGVVCDVGDDAQVDLAVKKAIAYLGNIDILVNNAGIMKSAPLVNLLAQRDRRHSRDLWQQVMDVNLNAVFYVGSTVAEQMLRDRSKGVIVNVSSIAAQGNAGQSAYAASKAGVEALTKVWAKELGLFGIRCAAVSPGFANTQGAADALEAELLERWIAKVPLRRLGVVDEVVEAILFVIKNEFFNGRILQIDGGLVI